MVNGVRLHYVEAGYGPLVLLLHGFPDFWYCWRHQLPVLAEAGFRVIAPDLRGYNTSEKPDGIRPYRLELLSADVLDLICQAGATHAHIIGHDWGGVIAWHIAMHHPDVVERLAILNAPHPVAFVRQLRTLDQLWRSWYLFFFQLPWLPEWWLHRQQATLFERLFRRDLRRADACTDTDLKAYQQAFTQPGVWRSAVNYYRALFRYPPRRCFRPVSAPTLLIWGERDRYLGVRLTEGLQAWVRHLHIERLPHAGHWAQYDDPERVNALLTSFLRS